MSFREFTPVQVRSLSPQDQCRRAVTIPDISAVIPVRRSSYPPRKHLCIRLHSERQAVRRARHHQRIRPRGWHVRSEE